ncbi:MAG: hypothetical protein AAGA18_10450 [Verrucomicrobiota bacterium]
MRILVLIFTLISSPLWAKDLTAIEAYKLAQKKVNKIAKTSLVQIEGKPNSPVVLPNEWNILFYDPYAEQNGTLVRVAGNSIVQISDGFTQLEKFRMAAYKQEEIILEDTLKIDSPDVLKILKEAPELRGIKISSIGLWLKKKGKGPLAPSHWRVTMLGLKDGEEVRFGTANINCTTGTISDLKVDYKKLGMTDK